MRNFLNTILILFVIATLYILRDDISSLYNKVLSEVSAPTQENSVISEEDTTEDITNIKTTKESIVEKVIEAPGALKVLDSLISDEVKLSRSEIIRITNLERKNVANLPPLIENSKLNLSAEQKVQDMFDNQYFEHVSPSGVGVADLGDNVGYEYIIIGENLALGGFKDDQAVVTAWMNSPGHRANILNNRYSEIGIGVGRGFFDGQKVLIAVQHFGLPRSACPSIDESLKKDISGMQEDISDMQEELEKRKEAIENDETSDNETKNANIDAYNKLVNSYNNLVAKVKQGITKYNAQVVAFNKCIEE